LSISSFVKGGSILCKSYSCIRSWRLKCMLMPMEQESLFLNSPHMWAAFSAWLVRVWPPSMSIEVNVLSMYLLVVATWKNLVLSSPNFVHLTVYRCHQYCFWNCRSLRMWTLRVSLRTFSWENKVLFSSSLSRISSTSLHWLICIFSLERPKAHHFKTLLRSLNFAASLVALLEADTSVCHADWTMSRKPGMSVQKLSNLKTLAFGIEVPT
jgi:hypothetical protein